MLLKAAVEKNNKNGLVIQPDIGWAGPKPAKTKDDKIYQIKTEFIDSRALLIEGAKASDFDEYPCVLADVSVQHLIQYIDNLGKQKNHKCFLVIDGLDNVSESEQENFVPLLKSRQILYSKLPDDVHILIPVTKVEAVSKTIKSLTFLLKVTE